MANFLKNPALIVTLGASAIFALCTLFFTPDQMSDATASIMMLACALGLWRWGPTGWRVYWKGAKRPEDWGILAVCALFGAIIAGRFYGIVYRQLGRPASLDHAYWSPFLLYVLLGAVVLLVAATKDPPAE